MPYPAQHKPKPQSGRASAAHRASASSLSSITGREIEDLMHKANALQRAILVRGVAVLRRAARQDSSVLEKALSAPDEGSFLAAIAEELSPAEDTEYPAITESLRRGLELRNELLREEGGTLTADQVRTMLHVDTPQAVYHLVGRGHLFSVPVGVRRKLFPAWQFHNGRPLQGLDRVLAALSHEEDPWARFSFFLSAAPSLGGKRPLDFLREGNVDAVVLAAEGFGEQGGQ